MAEHPPATEVRVRGASEAAEMASEAAEMGSEAAEVAAAGAPAAGAEMDLAGTGRSFLWSTVPSVITLIGQIFLLSFSVRRLGRAEYGSTVVMASATSVLTLFSGALRYSVVRSGAVGVDDRSPESEQIRAAHALFAFGAVGLLAVGLAVGWVIPVDLGLHGTDALRAYVAAVIFVASSAVLFSVTSYSGVLAGREHFGLIARISLAGFAVQAALTVALAGALGSIGLALAALGGSLTQAAALHRVGRRRAPWLSIVPTRPSRAVIVPVLRYAGGLAILSATSTLSSASDSFIIGAINGGAAVSVFRVGSTAPISLAGLLYVSFGVLFPRIVRHADRAAQEEGVAWMGRVVGWGSGLAFAALGLLAPDFVRLLLGRPDAQAVHILWICAAAMCVDVSYHGVVQVIFARGQQGVLARYSWVELVVNLASTVVGVELYGPEGSAIALAVTIVATDLIGFPLIMRGLWRRPGRFVWANGVVPSMAGGAVVVVVAVAPLAFVGGWWLHAVISGLAVVVGLGVGLYLLGRRGRSRLLGLVGRSVVASEAAPCA